MVSSYQPGKFIWGAPGKGTATLDGSFDELDEERSAAITAISMLMSAAFEKSAARKLTSVTLIILTLGLVFRIDDFTWTAILGALVVSFVGMLINMLLPDELEAL